MEKRVVIKDKEVSAICDDCVMKDNCKDKDTYKQARCCFNFQFIPANIEVEKYPETFDEFVKLVEDMEGICIIQRNGKDNIVCIEGDEEEGVDFNFYRDGRITVDNYKEEWEIAKDRTPKQMYRIFDDLTMEE